MNIVIILLIGLILRLTYLFQKTGNIFLPDLGGDSCYHYNVAYNIANGLGPKTNFIFSYWFYHDQIPAMTELYGPGYYYFLSLFLFIKEEFIMLRIANIIIGLSSILLAYLIGKSIHSKKLGYVSALIICFNFFHIENSVVVMRENFNLFLIQLFFLNLFLLNKSRYFYSTLGLIIGYFAITNSGWFLLFIAFAIYTFISYKKNFSFFVNYLLLIFFFIIAVYPWAIESYDYFGKFLFTYTALSPYTNDAGSMLWKIGLPTFKEFWITTNFYDYFKNHLFWGLKNIYQGHKFVFPTFVYFFSFILLPTIFYSSWKLGKQGFFLLGFTIFYFLGTSFSSYSVSGNLWPRHFMPFLATISILLGYGLILIYEKIINFQTVKIINLIIIKNKIILSLIPIIITILGILLKPSFWERENFHFYEFGKKIKSVTSSQDVIMYHSTVSDGWCATKRDFVQDISYIPEARYRTLNEVKKYKVSHLFIDLSDYIYQRSHYGDINKIKSFYKNINLDEILIDKKNGYYFYKVTY